MLLSSLTTIGLGGPATRLITARSADDVAEALRDPDDERALVIGGGSNLIVADAGLAGAGAPGCDSRPAIRRTGRGP